MRRRPARHAAGPVLLADSVAQLAAAAPLTPGGVGIVETAMVGVLVSSGASGASGAAATATDPWMAPDSHWLPIPIGLALLPTLRH